MTFFEVQNCECEFRLQTNENKPFISTSHRITETGTWTKKTKINNLQINKTRTEMEKRNHIQLKQRKTEIKLKPTMLTPNN